MEQLKFGDKYFKLSFTSSFKTGEEPEVGPKSFLKANVLVFMVQLFRKNLFSLSLICLSITGIAQTIVPVKVEQLAKVYQTAKGPTIVNFWSTWCKPCVEEIPHFIALKDSLQKEGVKLMLVSLDTKQIYSDGTLKKFLSKKGWKANFFWLNETDADHYCPVVDPKWSGVIPVTLIINPAKNYHHFYEEPLSKPALTTALKAAL